jgi:hypothetical protein
MQGRWPRQLISGQGEYQAPYLWAHELGNHCGAWSSLEALSADRFAGATGLGGWSGPKLLGVHGVVVG